VILFMLAMNMLVKSAEVQCRGPLTNSGIRQLPLRAFMYDLSVMTTSVPGSRWILKGLEEMITWACMSLKFLRKGKTTDKFCFTLGSTQIPSITKKPVKSLGKLLDCSLRDTEFIRATNQEHGSLVRGNGQVRITRQVQGLAHLVSKVPIPTVKGFERRASRFLRKWLGLPWGLSSIALYGHNNKLKLPISSQTHIREVLQCRESCDPQVSQAGIEVKTGRKWRAAEFVDAAVSEARRK